ncbi:MAG: cation diffusion facilitator family transporter [Gemmatimonadaceae bacterium]
MHHGHADHAHDRAHGHAHEHGHPGHAHGRGATARRLWIALGLTAVFLVAEVVGGIVSNSLALLADAGHMLTDVAALGLSLFVHWFSRRAESPSKTYGYLRLEILAAFLNGATLLLVSAWIIVEAIGRLSVPEAVSGGVMLAVAVGGLLVNLVAAWVLHPSSGEGLNVRGAYLHVLGDLLGSVATVGAALAVRFGGWVVVDPVASVLVTLFVVRGSWRLVRESVDILLESTPAHIPLGAVRQQLEAIPGIESVHDLHVWTVTSGVIAMSAHAIVREPDRHQHVLEHVHDAMRLFGIGHVTVQLERREMYEREAHLHP